MVSLCTRDSRAQRRICRAVGATLESAANLGLHTHPTGIGDSVSLYVATRPTIQSGK